MFGGNLKLSNDVWNHKSPITISEYKLIQLVDVPEKN